MKLFGFVVINRRRKGRSVSVLSPRGRSFSVGVRSRASRAGCASTWCEVGAAERGRAVRDAWSLARGAVAPRGDCPVMYILCALESRRGCDESATNHT